MNGVNDVYIIGGLRSYIGLKGGIYRHVPAEILGAQLCRALLDKYKISTADCIICGNGVGAGGNITRLMALEAGLDCSVPAFSVDMQCCSGLESVVCAAEKIGCGHADLIIAGGFESSSTQPRRAYNANHPAYNSDDDGANFYDTAKFTPGEQHETAMLEGAEYTALKYGVSAAEMDAWVLKSHAEALEARSEHLLDEIIAPVCGASKDEGIRPRMSQRLLDRMPKLLPGGKLLTAANACLINDGAAMLLLCSGKYLKQHGLTPMAKIKAAAACGTDPLASPLGAVTVTQKILHQNNLSAADVDAFELNEAFAVIDVLFDRAFPGCKDKYNVFGGALAYGHPYGASGAVILLHLLASLQKSNGRLGCCSIAGAGGLGSSLLVERMS